MKQSSVIDVQATSFPTNKSSGLNSTYEDLVLSIGPMLGNVRDDASQSTTTSFCTNTTSIPTDEDVIFLDAQY